MDPGDRANDAARFDATLLLDRPRWVEVSAIGPLVAPTPARVVKTIWLYPGKSLSPADGQREDGLLLEIPGLLVDVLAPPAHYLPNATQPIVIRANVTMMCGCPINTGGFWPSADFEVTAYIQHSGQHTTVPLGFVPENEIGAPSQFASKPWTPGGFGDLQHRRRRLPEEHRQSRRRAHVRHHAGGEVRGAKVWAPDL